MQPFYWSFLQSLSGAEPEEAEAPGAGEAALLQEAAVTAATAVLTEGQRIRDRRHDPSGRGRVFAASGGSIVLIRKARAARARSRKAMAFYAQMGDNWDYREIQKQVEETYFQVQECWRRMDVTYGAPYLSQELMEEFDSKIQWMQVRGEAVVQRNVRLLSAMPVYVEDNPGEEYDMIWYLIHGKMTGYYIDVNTRKVVRGNTRPEAFFEYWKFVYRGERWVLQEIRQKEEMDIGRPFPGNGIAGGATLP